jgi:hypothetical protein
MITGTPRRFGNDALEAKRKQIQLVDEHVDHADGIVF